MVFALVVASSASPMGAHVPAEVQLAAAVEEAGAVPVAAAFQDSAHVEAFAGAALLRGSDERRVRKQVCCPSEVADEAASYR